MKVGIDPGLNGAIAFCGKEGIFLMDMPTLPVSWKKPKKDKKGNLIHPQMVDVVKLYNLFRTCPHKIEQISIEIVHTMPKDSGASSFVFGGAFYSAVSAVRLAGYIPRMIFPQYWKSKFGLIGLEKDASRLLACKLYPELAPKLKFKYQVDKADALFIATC